VRTLFYALSFLVIEHPIVCARIFCGEGSSLGNIVKGCWVFPLFEKGFPRITSCVLCMVILLVILVYCSYCVVALFMVQVHAKLKRNYMCLSHH
jgi:hypothetical protein